MSALQVKYSQIINLLAPTYVLSLFEGENPVVFEYEENLTVI
jgi:hypothetical protein